MPDHLTENELLALTCAQQAITIAQQAHRLAVLQIRAAHGMAPEDTIHPDGSIVRAPKPAPTAQPEAPDAAPEVTAGEA